MLTRVTTDYGILVVVFKSFNSISYLLQLLVFFFFKDFYQACFEFSPEV
jgi:hypothetical protein